MVLSIYLCSCMDESMEGLQTLHFGLSFSVKEVLLYLKRKKKLF